tara:strand:- start:104 stop:643 length:540 start_codon:yes stop_codon:yes gene_type:complete
MANTIQERTVGWSSHDVDPNDAYAVLLTAAAAEWGMTEKEVEEFMDRIEYHESKGDHTAKQILKDGSIGHGRGLFQYEMNYGGERQGGSTARRHFGQWMEKEQGIDVGFIPEDFSRIGPQLQRAIFLADALRKGGSPKHEGVLNWWRDKHWAGEGEDRFDRVQSFIRDMKDYDREEIFK